MLCAKKRIQTDLANFVCYQRSHRVAGEAKSGRRGSGERAQGKRRAGAGEAESGRRGSGERAQGKRRAGAGEAESGHRGSREQSPRPTVDCPSLDGLPSGMALHCRLSSEGRPMRI
jgi:hypothetical protein